MTSRNDSSATACCRPAPEKKGQGFLTGLIYGIIPHTFCILFIVLSIVGATAATTLVRQILFVPYFFEMVIALSVVFATLSAVFYLRRNGLLSRRGVGRKWRYLTVMYATTIAINLLFFRVVFPAVANLDWGSSAVRAQARTGVVLRATEGVTLAVDIPCPGHAPLIISELRKVHGVNRITYRQPNLFDVSYAPELVSLDDLLAQEVFTAFPAEVRS